MIWIDFEVFGDYLYYVGFWFVVVVMIFGCMWVEEYCVDVCVDCGCCVMYF